MENQDLTIITDIYFSHAELEHIELEKGETVFDTKDCVSHIYFLIDGELSIIKDEQMIWQAYHHQFIGISSYFNSEACYSYKVKTNKRSTLIRIKITDFEVALQKFPVLYKELMKLFNKRINYTLERAHSNLSLTRKTRLIRVLIEKVERNQNSYMVNYTIKEIAEFVGVPLSFVKRALSGLQERNMICLIQNSIVIMDYNGLKRAASF